MRITCRSLKLGIMKKSIVLTLTLICTVSHFASAADPTPNATPTPDTAVARAIATVPILRDAMKDPDSFVLEHVIQAYGKDPKQFDNGLYNICYTYRAKNSYGGYDRSIATQGWGIKDSWGVHGVNGKLFFPDQYQGHMFSKDQLIQRNCGKVVADLTAEVKAALVPASPSATPPPAK